MGKNRDSFLYYLCITLLFLLSFRLFSSLYYPLLNSDHAVSVLMVHYFQLPDDLYFWGQDRLGSLIPLIAQVPDKVFHLTPLVSESIVHYAILLAGFLAFASFFQSKFYKVIFAVAWFFPPFHLIDVTQFSFGLHYSLLAIACWLLSRVDAGIINDKKIRIHLAYFFVMVLLIAAVWVSDMAMVSVFLLLLVRLLFSVREKKGWTGLLKNPGTFYAMTGIVLGYFFIQYAKLQAPVQMNYAELGSPEVIFKSLSIFFHSIMDLLLFRLDEPFTGIYSWLVLSGLAWVVFNLRKFRMHSPGKKWLWFFASDAVILFILIIVSKWTLMNNVPRRYFTCTYISLSFVLLMALGHLELPVFKMKFIKVFVAATVLSGGIGTVLQLRFVNPQSLRPAAAVVGEFRQLGEIGIISDYWTSYLTSCVDPEKIAATPYDLSGAVRNPKLVDVVFQKPRLLIIKDRWLDSFPDTLTQFGHTLVKEGKPFHFGGFDVSEYLKVVK